MPLFGLNEVHAQMAHQPVPNQEFLIPVLPNEEYPEFMAPKAMISDDNYMWIVGVFGILRYDGVHQEYFDFGRSELRTTVTLGIVEHNDALWMCTKNGIRLFFKSTMNSNEFTYGEVKNFNQEGFIYLMHPLDDQRLLVASTKGLGSINLNSRGDSLAFYPAPIRSKFRSFYCMEKTRRNNLIVGSNNGFIEYGMGGNPDDSTTFRYHTIKCLDHLNYEVRAVEDISEDILALYAVDSDRNTYLVFYNREDEKCNILNNLNYKLPDRALLSYWDQLLLDANFNLWWSSFGNPIIKYRLTPKFDFMSDTISLDDVSVFKEDKNNSLALQDKYISRIQEDQYGNIWITSNTGISRWSEQTRYISKVNLPIPFSEEEVHKVLYDEERGVYWVASAAGVLCFNSQTRLSVSLNEKNTVGEFPLKAYDIAIDSLNNLWVAAETGLYCITSKQDSLKFNSELLPLKKGRDTRNAIGELQVDRRGNYYVHVIFGNHFKVNPYTKQKWRFVPDTLPIPAYKIFADSKDSLWLVDVNSGLRKVTVIGEKFDTIFYRSVSTHPELSINRIIQKAEYESVLLNDRSELVVFNWQTEKQENVIQLNHFGRYGIHEMICHRDNYWFLSVHSLLKYEKLIEQVVPVEEHIITDIAVGPSKLSLHNDHLLVPGRGSFYIVDLEGQVGPEHIVPRFSYLKINDEDVRAIVNGDSVPSVNVDLTYDQNNIEVFYSIENMHYETHTKFQYKLEGVHDDWINGSSHNSIRLTHLSPGKYVLKLRASSGGSPWTERVAQLILNISPPWYWSLWSKLLYLLLGSILTYYYYLFRLKRKLAEEESARLRELTQLKSQLYTNITHEFRTPLTVIQGMVERIGQVVPPKKIPQLDDSLDLIDRNSAKLLSLVNQMLDLAKVEQGKLELKLIQGDVLPYLRFILDGFHSMAQSKGIQLVYYAEVDNLVMDYDEQKLMVVMSNLLSNAIKYTEGSGKVFFHIKESLHGATPRLEVIVKDTGIGIAEAHLPHIFDRFYQVDGTDARVGEGTGIGLALTKELVELMKGEIKVNSSPGVGTSFSISIPITRTAEVGSFSQPTISIAPSELQRTLGKSMHHDLEQPLVLVVEDNVDVAAYLKYCLEDKYKILHAENGAIGLQMAIDHLPNLVLSDIMMPVMDGYTFCEKLKSDQRTDHIPVIILTAKVTDEDRIRGLSAGADAYLNKPFKKEELMTRINYLIEIRRKLISKFAQTPYSQLIVEHADDSQTQFVQRATQIILDHLDDHHFGPQVLSRELNLSASQVYRKLKSITDKSTGLFIRSIKLQVARDKLMSTDLNVSEIAYLCGFDDVSYFNRVFKKEFGTTPGQVRDRSL